MSRAVWLDADPGHDDAIAILLALNCPRINLLGISTVHGNAPADLTWQNALRLLHAFGAPADADGPHVYAGAAKPLLRKARSDAEIHGSDGLGGVEGLPNFTDISVQARIQNSGIKAIDAMAQAVRHNREHGQGRTTLVATGPQTNLAIFFSVYPELRDSIEEVVFMGGGVGLGNRSSVAEYNILCDRRSDLLSSAAPYSDTDIPAEASQIVLDFPVRKIMIPINVSHKAILTRTQHARLLSPHGASLSSSDTLPKASTALRHAISTMLTFFADTYKSTFGFDDGPPLHDPLTIAYIAHPEWFRCKRYRVDIELSGSHSTGETVVDIWNYRSCDDSWGPLGKNCLVAEFVDVPNFFNFFLECVANCDKRSPLNHTS